MMIDDDDEEEEEEDEEENAMLSYIQPMYYSDVPARTTKKYFYTRSRAVTFWPQVGFAIS